MGRALFWVRSPQKGWWRASADLAGDQEVLLSCSKSLTSFGSQTSFLPSLWGSQMGREWSPGSISGGVAGIEIGNLSRVSRKGWGPWLHPSASQ